MRYIVNTTDSEGRDLWPGISYPPGKLAPVGKPVDGDDLPKGAAKRLLARGALSPAPHDPEEA